MSKSVWRGIAIFLLLIIIGSVIAGYIFYRRGNIQFLSDEELAEYYAIAEEYNTATEYINGGSLITVDDNSEQDISFSVLALSSADFESYGINTLAESAYYLSATINPSDATNKNVQWSISFANPYSDWATGKDVSDYVTLSSYGLNATVTCLQAFGEQIVITVTSESNSLATASCTVDYVQRVNSVSLKNNGVLTFGSEYTGSSSSYLRNRIVTIEFDFDLSDGTIEPEITYSASMTLSDLPGAAAYYFYDANSDFSEVAWTIIYFYENTSDIWSAFQWAVDDSVAMDETGIMIKLSDLQIMSVMTTTIDFSSYLAADTLDDWLAEYYAYVSSQCASSGYELISYVDSAIMIALLTLLSGYDSIIAGVQESYANYLISQMSTLSGTLNVELSTSYGDTTFATFNESFSLTFDFTELIAVNSLSLDSTSIIF